MRGNRNVGGGPSGGGGGETKSPKERYDLIFLSISPEPEHDVVKTASRSWSLKKNMPVYQIYTGQFEKIITAIFTMSSKIPLQQNAKSINIIL
jgi:hypothetical protein